MRMRVAKILVVITSIIFFTDAIDGDIAIARILNDVFHTSFNSISRDIVEDASVGHKVQKSNRTIASTYVVAVDEDSPTTLGTSFPCIETSAPTPEAKVIATSSGVVEVTYLTLHTLLI